VRRLALGLLLAGKVEVNTPSINPVYTTQSTCKSQLSAWRLSDLSMRSICRRAMSDKFLYVFKTGPFRARKRAATEGPGERGSLRLLA
jgi:hypothetical protein